MPKRSGQFVTIRSSHSESTFDPRFGRCHSGRIRKRLLFLAPGTLTGGLRTLAPRFEPLEKALLSRLQSEKRWHADETRWMVFAEREGKIGYRWYTPLAGSQCRYFVFAGERLVALLSVGASAWMLAARERFIGWQDDERQRKLPLVVNNARFLILPWIQSKGLASKILSLSHRQLPNDWLARYGYRPVLLESGSDPPSRRPLRLGAAARAHR